MFLVFSLLLISGCMRKTAPARFDNDGFNRTLVQVYENFGSLGGATRSYDFNDPADWDAYMEELEILVSWLQNIATEYEVCEIVENSPYYKNTEMFGDIAAREFNQNERRQFIDENATPEFKLIYSQIINDITEFSIQYVIENSDLLPNEKLAFAACISFSNDWNNVFSTRGLDACDKQFNKDMSKCHGDTLGQAIVCVIIGVAFPVTAGGAAYGVLDAFRDYQKCTDNAWATFKNCNANSVAH